MPLKPDGTVIPSNFERINSKQNNFGEYQYNNYALRMGYIEKVLSPTHPRNKSRKFTEYDVKVLLYDHVRRSSAATLFLNCKVGRWFASPSDYMAYSLDPGPSYGKGNSVFILCDNGQSSSAYIVGSPEHPNQPADLDGHYFLMKFNGVKYFINKNGGLSITKENKGGGSSSLIMSDSGEIILADGTGQAIQFKAEEILITAPELNISSTTINLQSNDVQVGKIGARSPALRATDALMNALNSMVDSLGATATSLQVISGSLATESTLVSTPTAVGLSGINSNLAQLQGDLLALKTALTNGAASAVLFTD
jgi:hypothetical protein